MKGKLQNIEGRLEEAAGVVSGDHNLKEAGREDQVKGDAREAWGKVKDAGDALVDRARAAKLDAEAKSAIVEENERRYHDVHSPSPTDTSAADTPKVRRPA